MMTEREVISLIQKYQDGTCTQQERVKLEMGYINYARKYANVPFPENLWASKEAGLKLILNESAEPSGKNIPLFTRYRWLTVAASIVLVLGIGLWFFNTFRHPDAGQDPGHAAFANDIAPGKNFATLTLASGKKIVLSNTVNGEIAEESGITITKTAGGQLIYNVTGKTSGNIKYNTLETPKGGQYQIKLPDGTNIWLNAATILKFPSVFKRLDNRKVELSGEAYFEVAKDKAHPFIVKTDQQEVEVLGTHFNINSYPDEPATKTTLLEGSVKVTGRHAELNSEFSSRSGSRNKKENSYGLKSKAGIPKQAQDDVVLRPGQQSELSAGSIQIKEVNAENVIAWKNGEFSFKNEELRSIMRKVARWYNVEIIFQNEQITNRTFSGKVSKFDNVSKVLRKLEMTGDAKFKIEGRKIIVL